MDHDVLRYAAQDAVDYRRARLHVDDGHTAFVAQSATTTIRFGQVQQFLDETEPMKLGVAIARPPEPCLLGHGFLLRLRIVVASVCLSIVVRRTLATTI